MKRLRLITAFIVLTSTVVAQQPHEDASAAQVGLPQQTSAPAQDAGSPAKTTKGVAQSAEPQAEWPPHEAIYNQYVEYDKLPRGKQMRIAYELVQVTTTGLCINLVDRPGEKRVAPRVEIEGGSGLLVSVPPYPKGSKADRWLKHAPSDCASRLILAIGVRATDDTPVGEHHIRGQISWQTMTSKGINDAQQKTFDIPFEVVGPNEKVQRNHYFTENSALKYLMAPVAVGAAVGCIFTSALGMGCPLMD